MGCGSSTTGTVDGAFRPAHAGPPERQASLTAVPTTTTTTEGRPIKSKTSLTLFSNDGADPKRNANQDLPNDEKPKTPASSYLCPVSDGDPQHESNLTSASPSTVAAGHKQQQNLDAVESQVGIGATEPPTDPVPTGTLNTAAEVCEVISHVTLIGTSRSHTAVDSVPLPQPMAITYNNNNNNPQPIGLISHAGDDKSLPDSSVDTGATPNYIPPQLPQQYIQQSHYTSYSHVLPATSAASLALRGGGNMGPQQPAANKRHSMVISSASAMNNNSIAYSQTHSVHRHPLPPLPQQGPTAAASFLHAPQIYVEGAGATGETSSSKEHSRGPLYLSPHDEVLSVRSHTSSVAPSTSSNDAIATYLQESAIENEKLKKQAQQQKSTEDTHIRKENNTNLIGIDAKDLEKKDNEGGEAVVPERNVSAQEAPASALCSLPTVSSQAHISVSSPKEAPVALDATIFQSFTLVKKTAVTRNSTIFRFALQTPDTKLGLPIGQHMYLKATIDGAEVQRAYTPISSDDDLGYFELLVKMINVSNPNIYYASMTSHLDALKIGDRIMAKGPAGVFAYNGNGEFVVEKKPAASSTTIPPVLQAVQPNEPSQFTTRKVKAFGMIAGGSGITPMYQIIKAILKNPDDATQIYLLFANQTEEDIALADEIEALRLQKPEQLHVWHTLSREPADPALWPYSIGYIDEQMLREHMVGPTAPSQPPADRLSQQVPDIEATTSLVPNGSQAKSIETADDHSSFTLYSCVLMCGPPALIENACKPALERIGFTANQLFVF